MGGKGHLTKAQKEKILSVLKAFHKEKGLALAELPTLLREHCQLDWKDYSEIANQTGAFKKWLQEEFGKEILINGLRVVFPRFWDEENVIPACRRLCAEKIKESGSLLLSEIPTVLEAWGIHYKNFTDGKTLRCWILDRCPEFESVMGDGAWRLVLKGETAAVSQPSKTSEIATAAVSEHSVQNPETKQMHAISYMSWWNNNTRQIQSYLGGEKLNDAQCRDEIGRHFAEVLLGISSQGHILSADREGTPYLAFGTGYQTSKGNEIYCVLCKNPYNNAGNHQPWAMEKFCSPLEEDTDLAAWMRETFPQVFGGEKGEKTIMLRLEKSLQSMADLKEETLRRAEELAEAIRKGEPVREESAEVVQDYCYQLKKIEDMLQSLSWKKENNPNLGDLLERVRATNRENSPIMHMVRLFAQMTASLENYCDAIQLNETCETVRRDRKMVQDSLHENFRGWQELLRPYEALQRICREDGEYPTYETDMEVCVEYFGISLRMLHLAFCNARDDEDFGYLDAVKELTNMASKQEEASSVPTPESESNEMVPQEVDADVLLDWILSGSGTAELADVYSVVTDFPCNLLEKFIAGGRYREAEKLLADQEQMYAMGYTASQTEALLRRMEEEAEGLPEEWTFYGCGMRLFRILGNENRTAEKYLLVGLLIDARRCYPVLADLYRKEDQKEGFLRIWEKYGDKFPREKENEAFLLSVLFEVGGETALAYLEEHPYLLYRAETLPQIITMTYKAGKEALAAELEERAVYLNNLPPFNALEQCVVDDTEEEMIQVAQNAEEMESLGYDAEEREAILQNLTTTYREEEEKSAGMRLYLLQGNKNGAAERLLWQELAEEESVAVALMDILAREERWEEARSLYRNYSASLQFAPLARRAYLAASLQATPTEAMEQTEQYLQDCLEVIGDVSERNYGIRERLALLASAEEETVAQFFSKVEELARYMENSLCRSLILQQRDLRELVTQGEKLAEMGLSQEQIENCSMLYKTDAYSHGLHSLAIADRLYKFLGSSMGVAEAFALLALKRGKDGSAELLWNIYTQNHDEVGMYRLLQESSSLRENHAKEYATILFDRGEYDRFLEECASRDMDAPEDQLRILIARIKTEQNIDMELQSLTAEDIVSVDGEWVQRLLTAMAEKERFDQIADFQLVCFDKMLDQYDKNTLRQFVTVSQQLDTDAMAMIRQRADEANAAELVIYFDIQCGLNPKSERAEDYYQAQLSLCKETTDSSLRREIIQRMMILFDGDESRHGRLAMMEMEMMANSDKTESILQKMGNMIQETAFSSEEVAELLAQLEETEFLGHHEIDAAILLQCEKTNQEDFCLRTYHRLAESLEEPLDSAFDHFLCQLYLKAFEGAFPEELLDEAEQICLKILERESICEGIFCLYRIMTAKGNDLYAEAALRLLADDNESTLGKDLADAVSGEVTMRWTEHIPSMEELFYRALEEESPEKVSAFCDFCGIICPKDSVLYKNGEKLLVGGNADPEASSLVEGILSHPQEGTLWEKIADMPLGCSGEAQAKAVYLAYQKNPYKVPLWEKAVEYCEKQDQDELLLSLLLSFASQDVLKYGAMVLRKWLAEKAESNPRFFSRWTEEEGLAKLTAELCRQLERETGDENFPVALRDLTTIVVAMDHPDLLNMVVDGFGSELFGQFSNFGLAMVCRMLLREQYDTALPLIGQLAGNQYLRYRNLVRNWAEMTPDALKEWCLLEDNQELINLVLPNGNYPDIQVIRNFTMQCIAEGREEQGATLLCRLLDNIPTDFACYHSLYTLSKYLPHRIDFLHRALTGMVRYQPTGNSYYRLVRKDYAILLAHINALVVAQGKTEEISAFDGYDFHLSAGEFYNSYETGENFSIASIAEIRDAQSKVQNALENQNATGFDILCDVIVSWVTGDWSQLLIKGYGESRDLSSSLSLFEGVNNGFARGVLRAVYAIKEEDRDSFMDWVKETFSDIGGRELGCARYLYLQKQYDKIPQGVLETDVLNFPYEEYSLFECCFAGTVRQMTVKAPEAVYPCGMIAAVLANYDRVMGEYWKCGMEHFKNRHDQVAFGIFRTLYEMAHQFKMEHREEVDTRKNREVYQVMSRITGVFMGRAASISKISSNQFHSWSCVNMILQLLYTERASEVTRLKQYLSDENRQLADAILRGIRPEVSDEEKMAMVLAVSDPIARALLCFIFRYWNRTDEKYYFVKNGETAKKFNQMYMEIAKQHPDVFNSKLQFKKYIILEPYRIHASAYRPVEGMVEEHENYSVSVSAPSEETRVEVEDFIPAFAREIEALDDENESMEALWAEHERIPAFGKDSQQERMELSLKIYRLALAREKDFTVLLDYLFRYGVDYYYSSISQKEYEGINHAVLEMALLYPRIGECDGKKALRNAMRSAILHELLHKGYRSLSAYMEDYSRYKNAFINMRDMLSTSTMSLEAEDVSQVYAAMETLIGCYEKTSSSHTAALRRGLVTAQKQLGNIGTIGWYDIRLSLRQMIQDEINRMDLRPMLRVIVLNKETARNHSCIFGQIQNIGRDTAEEISLQMDCGNGVLSGTYYLDQLAGNEEAAFEIACPKTGSNSVEYELTVRYHHKETELSEVYRYSLQLVEDEVPDFKTSLYLTDRPIVDFTVGEDGEVNSPDFYGRSGEKAEIHAIFDEETFAGYKNVIIRGIRRAGKTSLLHYLLTYAESHCEDAVVCKIDCQSITTTSYTQSVFIDKVLRELSFRYPDLANDEKWIDLTQRWALPAGCTDRDPDELQYFYRELKQVTEKGLILVLDEIDTLFERIEKVQGLDGSLFPALRALLCNGECMEAVHLILCGSNQLIRYMDGGTLNQLFQQFGDNTIEVGRLLNHDMNDMLDHPLRSQDERCYYTAEALEWIWKYTKGSVWYAKLLGNCVVKHVKWQNRSVVYPSDVCNSLDDVLQDGYFKKNVSDSCRESELLVLDAMQSLTSKPNEYLSDARIAEQLEGEISQSDIEAVLTSLVNLQMIERNPYDRNAYRFAVEVYWYYFRVRPSKFDRVPETLRIFKEQKVAEGNATSNATMDEDY